MMKRLLSLLLCLCMTLTLLPSAALAYLVDDKNTASSLTFTDSDGNTQNVDESWTERFPYGAFAFEKSSLAVPEGESDVIKVYRLGGTAGRATAYLTYEPVLIQDEDGNPVYDYAVSADDVDIAVEEPQPIAQYQPVGKPPAPASGDAVVTAVADELGYTLRLSKDADAYQWQILHDGDWEDILDATSAEVPADAEFIDGGAYDYRCLYTVDKVKHCSRSLSGTAYVPPEEEPLDPVPEGIALNAAPTYTKLDLRGEGAQPYDGWAFELIFADGEWVKEIHLDALKDELPEVQEAAAFTIQSCEGGEVMESANTLLLSIKDQNVPEPSTLGFILSEVTVDKAEGTAKVMVERVGGNQRPVSVEYKTQDGTAMAGRDYASASGKLMFYAGVKSLPATVELIYDGLVADAPVYFDITLSELLGDDSCALNQTTVRVNLINSGLGGTPSLSTQLYDPDAVDVSGTVGETAGAANSGDSVVTGVQTPLAQPESVYSQLVFGGNGEISTQVYTPSLANIKFANPSDAWTSTAQAAQKSCWGLGGGNGSYTALYGTGQTATKIGKDYNGSVDVPITGGVALASRGDAAASLTATGWEALGGPANIAGQLFQNYSIQLLTRQGHDTAYLDGFTYKYSYTKPNLKLLQGSKTLVNNPLNIGRFGSGPMDKNWTIRVSDSSNNYANPFSGTYTGNFELTGALSFGMSLWYNSYDSHQHDELNDASMAWLQSAQLTRRTFAANAIYTEVSTPNDSNTAPANCTVLSDSNYNGFLPSIEIVSGQGGANSSNQLYVGSTLKISAGTAPAGYYVSDLVIYQSTDQGKTWNVFNKFFTPSYDSVNKAYSVKLVGKESTPLTAADLNAQYKFRVAYSRTSTVTVDVTPSVPRQEANPAAIDTNRIGEVYTGYRGASDHGFSTGAGVTADITYGCSIFDSNNGDFSKDFAQKIVAKPTTGTSAKINFTDTNIQWVCFNLSAKDLLLINGTAYPGNAKIYLKESDFAGGLNVLYYHQDYQTAQSAMETAISWMAVYWDANGNGKIDGYYNESNSTFTLTPVGGVSDEFCGYITAGSANETQFAPKKNSAGSYCQYFIKTCYTMTPRSLVLPVGASDSERAQVLPSLITAVNADSAAYSKLTPESRSYRYLVSGLTKQSSGDTETRSSDGHLKYGNKASAKSTLDIPLGGDYSPPTLAGDKKSYTWSPEFRGNILYPFAAPEPITVENSIAGPTEVTKSYTLVRDSEGAVTGYTYTEDGLNRMNGYLSSFTGTTTFALVTQEQRHTTDAILAETQSGTWAPDYSVKPDSVTLSQYSTTPDAEYLKQMDKDAAPKSDLDMDDSGSKMSEFNVDLGINLGALELPITEYVTLLLDENKVGFAIGLPLAEVGSTAADNKGFADKNKENWTKFSDFFKSGNYGGDESFKNASQERNRVKSANAASPTASPAPSPTAPPATPDGSKFKSKSFSVGFAMGLAFLFEYNPLDNGYYFEGMTVSFKVSLSFRIQARLTVCPIVYFYLQFDGSIEIGTGLGVIRDSVDETPAVLNGKSASDASKQVKLTYMVRPSAGVVITAAKYGSLSAQNQGAYKAAPGGAYYYLSSYANFDAAKAVYLETGDYFLTEEQYGVLSAEEQNSYTWSVGGSYYNSKNYSSYNAAMTAYNSAASYSFETGYKAFNLRFSGKLAVEVYTKSGSEWKAAGSDSGYISGFLSSDGTSDTQVVLKKQDGMTLGETVKVVLRPLDHDEKLAKDVTVISYIARIKDIRSEVYWKGISISPAVGLEVGAGIGVELMKIELYAKIGLEATFLLGKYNAEYSKNPDVPKYSPASVEHFGFSIGIGLRVVLLVFTFELDAVTYTVDYDGKSNKWETGWHFLNDWVQDASDSGFLGVTISPPRSAADRQKLYAPADNAVPEMSSQAYDPTDSTVPFQLSGYGKSVDAANLTTGIIAGSDYKVVTAGDRDFILYTISRSGSAADEDATELVLSELTRVNTAQEGKTPVYKYGLANPTGGTGAPLYLVLDEDGTGDLDFDAWVEESVSGGTTTYTIHSAWVSYAAASTAQSQPTRPAGNPYQTPDGTEIGADNYKTIPAPPVPLQPAVRDYYTTATITAEEYSALTEEEQKLCETNGDGGYTQYTLNSAYTTIDAARHAFSDAQTAYSTAQSDYELYQTWYTYYDSLNSYNAYVQSRLKNAARNTVLKSAAWSYTVTPYSGDGEGAPAIVNGSAFNTAERLGGDGNTEPDNMGYVFSPAGGGSDAVFFGSTAQQDTDNAEYKKYETFLEDSGASPTYADYLRSTKKSNLDVFGVQSSLNLAYKNSTGDWAVSSMALAKGQTVSNVEFTKLSDGAYYLAYTTRQDAYEGSGDTAEHVTVERLCLRKVTLDSDTVTWGDPYLIRMTRDYDQDSTKDGIYKASGEVITPYESPYFSNLSFLTARLDSTMLTGTEEDFSTMDATEHTFLLFEMNGATYLILDDSLQSIVTSGKGTIHPFFMGATQVSEDGTKAQEASGKLEVTIGADKNGNLFAVYAGSVPNTTNNALYLSAYDAATNTWGDGVMLAMRNMDTYEASIRYDWGKLTTQAAYLGLSGTQKPNGLLTETDVQHLYGSDADDILTNLKAYPSTLGDKHNLVFSNLQAAKGAGGELLVVTQGASSTLGVAAYTNNGKTQYTVMPNYKGGGMDSSLGMYAISYGKSSQALGEGKISFGQPDFSMDSRLYVNLSAVNTGDTAFRGSEAQPITAELTANGQLLATWEIKENIRSGQTVAMDGDCAALLGDLPEGATFTLTLKEYTGGSYVGSQASIDLFTVQKYPDLAVEDLTVDLANVSADGSKATLNVSFVAANRGSGKADGVYAQFTYADGKDQNGESTYAVLPLTGSELTINQAEKLKTQAADDNEAANLAQGILYLYNAADKTNDLEAGYGRRVSGTIVVPSAAFAAGESGYLDLKIELYTGSDKLIGLDAGVVNVQHDEYYAANNAQNAVVQASTVYTVAPSVVIPMGTTTLVPVTAVSTRGTKPALSVTEIEDTDDGRNLGILTFKQSKASGGTVSGVLSITPSAPGTGIIHLYDAETESQIAVAFTVTEAAAGIDIFNDNGAFAFKNADGSAYDAAGSQQSWSFTSAPTWGAVESAEEPLRRNLSYGQQGASFTFRTVAEAIDLYFQGTVTVSGDYPDFSSGGEDTYTNSTGGSTPTRINLGSNPGNTVFTVTVTVTGTSAAFDRMVEYYAGGVVPTPDYDGTSPLLIWSRSFPATASIDPASGQKIPLSLYVLDNSGLQYISIDAARYDATSPAVTPMDGGGLLWRYDFGELSANRSYNITAADTSGNTVSTTLTVDWFLTHGTGDTNTVNVPLYDADFYLDADKWSGGNIGSAEIGKLNISFAEQTGNGKRTDNTHEVYSFDGSDFKKLTAQPENPAVFMMSGNGIYWTRTVNSDNTWSAKMLYMDKVDKALPQVSLSFHEATGLLSWSAYKTADAVSGIGEVTVNGYKVNTQTGKKLSGTLPIAYSGEYVLSAKDESGNENSITYTVPRLALDLSKCSVTSTASWNQTRSNGAITVNLNKAVGGAYFPDDSDKAKNEYHARYQMTLVPGGYDLSMLGEDQALAWKAANKSTGFAYSYRDLNAGDYLLVVRDAEDHTNVASVPVTVADDAIVASTATLNVSYPFARDGQVLATAAGGNTQGFEFAILPINTVDSKKTYTIADFRALDTAESTEDDIVWCLADDLSLAPRGKTFTDLGAGWYLVAARGLYGVTDAQLITLTAARKVLADAESDLAAAQTPTEEELARLKAAVADAQAAYDSKAQALQALSAQAYGDEAGYWDGVHVVAVQLISTSSFGYPSNLRWVTTDGNGSAVYTIKSSAARLTEADNRTLAKANQQNNVVLKGGGLSLYLPKGTLLNGFDVNRLIVDLTAAKDGMVLRYTDLDGNASILPWCLVSDGAASYLIVGLGDYTLAEGAVKFRDITGLWGTDSIHFTALRSLFSGTGQDTFSPDATMTRAMFVTVLWRLAGSVEAEGTQTFTDLRADWYRQAVLWAVQNKIASGYSNEVFGPDDPVSREQMCVFLCRFLNYLGMELSTENPITFADAGSISGWATEYVAICANSGLIQGVGGNNFAPRKNAGRMEVSTILTRFVTKLVEKYCSK